MHACAGERSGLRPAAANSPAAPAPARQRAWKMWRMRAPPASSLTGMCSLRPSSMALAGTRGPGRDRVGEEAHSLQRCPRGPPTRGRQAARALQLRSRCSPPGALPCRAPPHLKREAYESRMVSSRPPSCALLVPGGASPYMDSSRRRAAAASSICGMRKHAGGRQGGRGELSAGLPSCQAARVRRWKGAQALGHLQQARACARALLRSEGSRPRMCSTSSVLSTRARWPTPHCAAGGRRRGKVG